MTLLLLLIGLLAACDSDECTGAACVPRDAGGDAGPPPPRDSGPDTGPLPDAGPIDSGPDTGPPACRPWVDPNACVERGDCPDPSTVRLDLMRLPMGTIATDEMANPEKLEFIPGSDDSAVAISSIANQLTLLRYTDTTLTVARTTVIPTGSMTRNISCVRVAPDASYAALTVIEQVNDVIGEVFFVDISDTDAFGTVLGRIDVGYTPDHAAFSRDGRRLITADEDDRQDHPLKPPTRFGGSVSIIDVSAGPAAPGLLQQIPVAHLMDSEPEGVATAIDGTVIVSIQETSQVGFFDLDDVPAAVLTVSDLPLECEPDGVAVSPDGLWAAIACERTDTVAILSMVTRRVVSTYHIAGSGDVPDDYNRDERAMTKIHEPQDVGFIVSSGAQFVLVTLQESHAVLAYRLDEMGMLHFDSIAPVGINYLLETGGRAGSDISPEGVAASSLAGLVLTAQEEEGSITLTRTGPTMPRECP